MTEASDVVRAHLDAFSRHDLSALLATLAPDAVFVTGTTVVDPAEFAEFFGWAMREIDPSVAVRELIADGSKVGCEFVESVTVDGARRRLNRAAFYVVNDGCIVAAKVYDERQ